MLNVSRNLLQSGNSSGIRRQFAVVGLVALTGLSMSAPANAQPVRFRYNGGHWSHNRHAGWHRYWGGPSIGFYYAPTPVFIVSGYPDPYYYTGPDFWYSDPSFGLSLNFGGGGYYRSPRYYRGSAPRWHGNGHYNGGWHNNGGWSGGNRWHGGGGQGGHGWRR